MNKPLTYVGQIVMFYPPNSDFEKEEGDRLLPNGMDCAPAIVTQCFGDGSTVNLTLFTAENRDGRSSEKLKWSVAHRSKAIQGQRYWDYLPQSDETPETTI